MIALIIYFIVALAFTVHWLKSGDKTYSMSYYALPDNKKWQFTTYCWGLGFTGILVFGTELMIIGAAGIMLVGVASDFVVKKVYEYATDDGSVVLKEKRIKNIVWWMHMAGTIIGVGFSQLSLWIEHNMWFLVVAFAVGSVIFLIDNKFRKLGWIELCAIISTLIGGIILKIN